MATFNTDVYKPTTKPKGEANTQAVNVTTVKSGNVVGEKQDTQQSNAG